MLLRIGLDLNALFRNFRSSLTRNAGTQLIYLFMSAKHARKQVKDYSGGNRVLTSMKGIGLGGGESYDLRWMEKE